MHDVIVLRYNNYSYSRLLEAKSIQAEVDVIYIRRYSKNFA